MDAEPFDEVDEYTAYPSLPASVIYPAADTETRYEFSWQPSGHHPQEKGDDCCAVVTLVHAAWALMTSRMTSSERVVFDTIDGRPDRPAVRPLRVLCVPSQTVGEYLQAVRAHASSEEEIYVASPDYKSKGHPTSSTLIATRPSGDAKSSNGTIGNGLASLAGYPLVLDLQLRGSRLQATAMSDSRCAEPWIVFKLLKRLEFCMKGLHEADSGTRLADIDLMSPDDVEQIWKWNGTLPAAVERCMHDMFEDQVCSQPLALAVDAWDGRLTYKELDELSEKLAGHLIDADVGPEAIVPLCFEKSMWMPVAMLGVLKAGGAFTLLEPSFPEQRLRTIVEKVNASVMISSPSNMSLSSRLLKRVVELDSCSVKSFSAHPSRARNAQPSSTAMFAVFTSGSTGVPKGAILTHTNYSSALAYQLQRLGFTKDSRVFDFASYAFDVSVHNVFATLTSGACLCIPSDEDRHNNISKVMADMRVTIAHLTPSVTRLIDPDSQPVLKTMVFTGEPLSVDDATRWWGKVDVVNEYGPAECTINTVNSRPISPEAAANIGLPVGVAGWITDPENDQVLVPIGCVGELLVEGALVGRGYIGDPIKTAASFIEDPKWLLRGVSGHPGRKGRLYKTGDLVRYCADGSLSYSGRKDAQVKIRGQRVHLGDVEHWTQVCMPEAQRVFADVIEPRATSPVPTLAVFVQSPEMGETTATNEGSVQIRAVRADVQAKLSQHLPSYMVPTVSFWMETLPMTPTGKMDRRMLRKIGSSFSAEQLAEARAGRRDGPKRQPTCEMEERMRNIWARVLGMLPQDIHLESNFFHLGGDSIASMRAVAYARRLGIQVTVAHVFQHPSLHDLAKNCSQTLARSPEDIPAFSLLGPNFNHALFVQDMYTRYALNPMTIQDAYPCTRLQEGLMFLTSKRPGDYIEQNVLELARDLSLEGLRNAWEQAVKAMPILRTRIAQHNHFGLVQLVLDDRADWDEAKGLEKYLAADRKCSMGLGEPLSRFALVRDEEGTCKWLVWTVHHAIYDGWSIRLVTDAVAEAYGGQSIPQGPQFQAFIKYVQDQDERAAMNYWQRNLQGFDSAPFPPNVPSVVEPVADAAVAHSFATPSGDHGCITTSMLIRAAWALVVGRMANSNDVVFGSTLHGRNAAVTGLDEMVAPTIATVPVRVRFCSTQYVSSYLQAITQEAAEMMPYEQTGLQRIAALTSDAEKACKFQTHVVIQPEDCIPGRSLLGQWRSDSQDQWFSTYALTIEVWLRSDGILASAMFDSRTIQSWVVKGMLQRLEWTMHQLHHATPSQILGEINVSSAEDLEQIWQWNEKVPEPVNRCIHDLLADQVQARPDSPAICAWDGELTYRKLEELSTKLSHSLLQLGAGFHKGLVPLCFDKSMWTAVAILGVLKAGVGFILLDPHLPEQRMRDIVDQIGSKVIVTCPTREMLCSRLAEATVAISWDYFSGQLDWTQQELPSVSPSSIAYVVFTSGSTGTPKGVVVTHANAVSAQHHQLEPMGHTPESRLFDFASYSFDVSISNIISMLACGGCLCVPSDSDRTDDIEKSIVSLRVNALDLTPSTLQLLSPERLPAVRQLTLGGEPLREADVEKWCGKTRICNAYGPSECTPTATINANPMEPQMATHIGKGAGVVTWIVDADDHDELLPPGCTGELLLEGPLIGRGYFNDSAKTAAAFIEDPKWLLRGSISHPGRQGRLYKTGDLVKYNRDGSLAFVGRKDTQVKVRGQRVEPGEIEAVLRSHESVDGAVVVFHRLTDQELWLAAFVTTREDDGKIPQSQSPAHDKTQLKQKRIQAWEEEFEGETYLAIGATEAENIGRDFIGWSSMYDGSEINKVEMNEWLDDTIATILNGGPAGHVFEIGSGSGMMLFNLANHGLKSYIGVDPAMRAVDFTIKAAKSIPDLADKVNVFKGTAEDIVNLDMPIHSELAVMNSVVQYFPSQDYLFNIIQHLASLGSIKTIFLGDIRSHALHKEFMARRALHIAGKDASREEFGGIMENLLKGEPELLLDPGFFTSLPHRIRGVTHVEILPKRMKATNELSSYRYAAVLHVNSHGEQAKDGLAQDIGADEWVDYVSNGLDRQAVSGLLGTASRVAISNIPYSKTIYEREIVNAVEASKKVPESECESAWLAAALQASQEHSSLCAFDLAELAQLAGYRVECSWARQYSQRGGLDAVFYRGGSGTDSERRTLFRFPTDHEGRPCHVLSTNPLEQQRESKMRRELEQLLRSKLPSYMVPQSIRILDKMPVNHTGKIDRSMLSESLQQKAPPTARKRLPSTAPERAMQQIWSKVLNIESSQIGLDDGFIKLGGNSLSAMKVVSMAREEGIRLEVADMFRHSITSIAHLLQTAAAGVSESKAALQGVFSDRLLSDLARYDCTIAMAQSEAANKRLSATSHGGIRDTRLTAVLTGANGFIGTQILRQLLDHGRFSRVIAIVRGTSASQARQRVIDAAKNAQWWSEFYSSELEVWRGDLALPRLGLEKENWNTLADGNTVDVFIHNGASVHFMKSYSALQAANVESTAQVLRVAAENPSMRVVYVSSARCCDPELERDEDVAKALADSPNGYTATKFIAEALVKRAAARGLGRRDQFAVVSPGLVVDTPTEGVANADDWLWRMAAACIRVGVINGEESDNWIPIADAAATATTVIETSLGRSSGVVTQVKGGLTMGEFWQTLRATGYALRSKDSSTWMAAIRQDVEKNRDTHPLGALSDMLQDLADTARSQWADSWRTGGLSSPARLKLALVKSAGFLSKVGVLPLPDGNDETAQARENLRAFTRSGG
uniref:Peramine synthetase n=2 Tax=Epichloe TaxID=5112 RepID=A0A059UMT0_EPICN|nr:peramine synthetase [Epichloe coenophiala]